MPLCCVTSLRARGCQLCLADHAASLPDHIKPVVPYPDYVRRKIARLGNASNTHHIGRFIAENITGLGEGMTGGGVDAPRPIRVASRSSRGADKVKMEPPDGLVGSPLSPSISPSLPTSGASPWIKTMSPQHYTVPSPNVGSLYPHHSPSSHLSPPPAPQQQQLYYGLPASTPTPSPSQSPYSTGGGVGVTSAGGSSYSMVLGSSVGGIVTVTSPIISPSTEGVAGGPHPSSSGTSGMHLLDLDSQRFVEQQQLQHHQLQQLHLQQHNLLPNNNSSNNTDFDMNQINSAELRSLLDTGGDMTAPFVEAHLSENLSSNLNIIDPNPSAALPPSSAPSNNLNNNLDLPLSAGGGAFMPNIMGGSSGGSKASSLTVTNFCDSLNTPTPSSDSFTNLKSELELLNNS
ncbi:hypothetical protein FHG87_015588 [Trinorchestia longiramus]|nr:hypothetical protein FHG87_015588 [Trinorchestia longiramus]